MATVASASLLPFHGCSIHAVLFLHGGGFVIGRDGYDAPLQAERRPVAADVVAFTHRMTRVATVNHSGVRRIRNATLRVLNRIPAVRRKMALNLSELAIDRRHPQADDLVGLAGASPDEPVRDFNAEPTAS